MRDAVPTATRVYPILPDEHTASTLSSMSITGSGTHLVDETMRYVVVEASALIGFGAYAFACKSLNVFLGCSADQHFHRLRLVTNNQRFCVPPQGRRKNLASRVLGLILARQASNKVLIMPIVSLRYHLGNPST